jgi:type IX secretion system substrate protein/pre-peptidase
MKTRSLLIIVCLLTSLTASVTVANAQAAANSCATITYNIPIGGCTGTQNIGDQGVEALTVYPSCHTSTYFESEGWYSFTVPAGPNKNVTVTGTSSFGTNDLIIQILSGTCASQTELGCANNIPTQSINQTESVTATNLIPGVYFIRLSNVGSTSNMHMSELCVTSTVTGIFEQEEQFSLSVYPNPFNTTATVSFHKEMKDAIVNIIDVLGRTITTETFSGTEMTVDKASLKPGIYFLQVTDENKHTAAKKIVIQ